MTLNDLSLVDLSNIAAQAQVFKHMGLNQSRRLVVDYIPKRDAMVIPREDGDGPLTPMTPEVISVPFNLEDAMFGGIVYVALTCVNRVVIHPFVWESYDKLANTAIPTR